MSNTSMLRISNENAAKLREVAKTEGRTIFWTANKAIETFLTGKTPLTDASDEPSLPPDVKRPIATQPGYTRPEAPYTPPEVKPKETLKQQILRLQLAKEQLCCSIPIPCKHWSWDGTKQLHSNSLSGREKVVA